MKEPAQVLAEMEAAEKVVLVDPDCPYPAEIGFIRSCFDYQRLAGALIYELNRAAASGMISREALILVNRLQQRTPEGCLAPLDGGCA
jgi:hypothetical protein